MAETTVGRGVLKGIVKLLIILGAGFAVYFVLRGVLAPPTAEGYRFFPVIGSRDWIWVIAQTHLDFAAFVLGVPIFAVTMEFMGWKKADPRLDRVAYDFAKLFTLAYTLTAFMGAIFMASLPLLYPKFISYMMRILGYTWWLYLGVMFAEVVICYLYFYSWKRMMNRKGLHVFIGVLLNLFGVFILLITSVWVGFMTTPAGVTKTGRLVSRWATIHTHMWLPLSLHRFVANIVFGAGIAAAYAAYRFITAKTPEEKAYYDWMGYTSAIISIGASLLLPGVGYLLGVEIYSFNEQQGIQLMGGFFAWLWVMQAILIGAILFFINYYLWISLHKMPGGERYFRQVKYLFIVVLLGYVAWITPHDVALSLSEARRMGAYHPVLGKLGLMAAKNTAVILSYMATFLSFAIFRRSNKEPTVAWAKGGQALRGLIIALSTAGVLFLGVMGYMVSDAVRVSVLSPIQFGLFFGAILVLFLLDSFMYRNAKIIGEPRWGQMPERSQYALIAITVTFTWLMGELGYMRAGARQYWHVYGIMMNNAPDNYLPTAGVASIIVTITTVLFLVMVSFVFWSTMRLEKFAEKRRTGL
ncbi:MAG: cytochrome ubiquinol oxidase subunit I [Nitrospiraceae bacterium]|nr:cytochrome ubiquinol oxidase subunit I [Nitrospiraceae bacterium]